MSFVIQDLTNQLVELERHFNNLEMNRSSETGRVASNRRAVYSNKTSSRYLTVRPFMLCSFQSDYVAHKCM
jgi:hypothetical protein